MKTFGDGCSEWKLYRPYCTLLHYFSFLKALDGCLRKTELMKVVKY